MGKRFAPPAAAILIAALTVPPLVLAPHPAAAQTAADTSFPLDAERRAANFERLAREFGQTNAGLGDVATQITDLLRQQDVIEPYLSGYGLASNDLVDVLALSWFSAIMLADGGRTDDPTQAQIDGLKARLSGQSASLSPLSATQKQDMADQLLFTMLVQQTVAEGLAGQPMLAEWMAEFATYNSALLGFDVTATRMEQEGLAETERADNFSSSEASVPAARDNLVNSGGSSIKLVGWDYGLELRYGLNGLQQEGVVTVHVLFEDGTACIDCLEAIVAGDLATYRAENPGWFGHWADAGSDYVITRSGGDQDRVAKREFAGPARPGTTIVGDFYGADGGHGILSIREVRFRSDGTFVSDSSTSGVSPSYSVYVDSAEKAGRYRIADFRITLDHADGSSEVRSYAPSPDEPDTFLMGGVAYVPSRDSR